MNIQTGQIELAQINHYRAVGARLSGKPLPPVVELIPVHSPRCGTHRKITARNDWYSRIRQGQRMKGLMAIPYDGHQLAKMVIKAVAKKHRITIIDMKSKRRNQQNVRARNEAIYRIYCKTLFSTTIIAQIFHRDHTTILHSIRKHKARIELSDNL